jgi:hypothetical protein
MLREYGQVHKGLSSEHEGDDFKNPTRQKSHFPELKPKAC